MLQNLRAINEAVFLFYPTIPNSYTIWTQIHDNNSWHKAMDLKDAFFSILLDM